MLEIDSEADRITVLAAADRTLNPRAIAVGDDARNKLFPTERPMRVIEIRAPHERHWTGRALAYPTWLVAVLVNEHGGTWVADLRQLVKA